MSSIWGFISDLYATAKSFGVDPLIFVVVYFGTTPFLLIPLYYIGRIALKKTDKRYFLPLVTILIIAFLAPYFYIILFGDGINIYIKIGVITFAILTLLRYLNKKLGINVLSMIRSWIKKGDD